MNHEVLNLSLEQITNPILRLMIYILITAVVALAGALVYMYRQWRNDVRERIAYNQEAVKALSDVTNAIENFDGKLSDFYEKIR